MRAVRYPGLSDHPGHELAARQRDGFGGMVSFEVASREALRVVKGTSLFLLGGSLGGSSR
ncbi:MAG: cystathionine gamma-synthase [Actinomycetota bacterium]|nr:cystathionine gamma-synthase [Actinomycetota bacterium]